LKRRGHNRGGSWIIEYQRKELEKVSKNIFFKNFKRGHNRGGSWIIGYQPRELEKVGKKFLKFLKKRVQ
jgi:hypothetical protein